MFKQVIFALFASIAFIELANGTCRDKTLDACDYGNDGPFETMKGIQWCDILETYKLYKILLLVFKSCKC